MYRETPKDLHQTSARGLTRACLPRSCMTSTFSRQEQSPTIINSVNGYMAEKEARITMNRMNYAEIKDRAIELLKSGVIDNRSFDEIRHGESCIRAWCIRDALDRACREIE